MKIGFVTCDPVTLNNYFPTLAEPDFIPVEPPFTPDDQIAVNHLRMEGCEVTAVQWGSDVAALTGFDLLVVRSPWDYMDSPEQCSQFMQWVQALELSGARVANPVAFMQWLLDKHYLRDLAQAGAAVIPTQYYEQGATLDLTKAFNEQGPFILKPCVSAAGIGLYFIRSLDDAARYQAEITARLQRQSYMRQNFIPEITTNGEWSLVFLGGEYSHAVHKKPGKDSILVHAERGGSLTFSAEPSHAVIDFARRVYRLVLPAFTKAVKLTVDDHALLYLRLDVIETNAGPVLIECEGVEPELFFRARAQSEILFTRAIKQTITRRN